MWGFFYAHNWRPVRALLTASKVYLHRGGVQIDITLILTWLRRLQGCADRVSARDGTPQSQI